MERKGKWSSIVLLLAACALPAMAADKAKDQADTRHSAEIASLLAGVNSDNMGLKESAACMLGDLKCTEAVIPLMRMLHEGKDETTRIVAALALSKIGDARGIYAVKQAVRFDSSPKVQETCAWFYNRYVSPDTFAFIPTQLPAPPKFASE